MFYTKFVVIELDHYKEKCYGGLHIFNQLFRICRQYIWPFAPHLPDLLITRVNLPRQMSFFSENGLGKCLHFGEYQVMASSKFGKFG
jgi:hypothetical protein